MKYVKGQNVKKKNYYMYFPPRNRVGREPIANEPRITELSVSHVR